MYTRIMYIGARQKKKFFVFFTTFIIFVVMAFAVVWVNDEVSEKFMELSEPNNVVLSNVLDEDVTVTWTTDVKTEGYLVLYSDGERIGKFEDSRGVSRYYTHYFEISNLKPNTSYEFEIFSAGEKRLNENEQDYVFTTRNVLPSIPAPNIVEGFVGGDEGLVFLLVDDLEEHYPLSTFVESDGKWSLDLSNFVSVEDKDFSFRGDTPLKILFHSEDGTRIVRGNKNVLFEEGEFKDVVEFNESENIFLHIPDVVKFKGGVVELREEEVFVEEIEEEEKDEEMEEVEEEVLGIEQEPELDSEWGSLESPERLNDYGLY